MVVREVLGKVVRKMPYSGYLPTILIGQDNEDKIEVSSLGITTSAERSPRDTIHNRIISNRAEQTTKGNKMDSTLELSCLNYCDTFDDFSIEASPINRLKSNETIDKVRSDDSETGETLIQSLLNLNKSYGPENKFGLSKMLSTVEEKNEDCDIKTLRIERYLNEQNKKFDELVDKNIDVVLQNPSNDLKRNVIGLLDVYDYKLQDKLMDISNIIGIACNNVMRFTPLKKEDSELDKRLDLESMSKESYDAANSEIDQIVRTIDNKSSVESLLESLDFDSKVELFTQLREELCYDQEGLSAAARNRRMPLGGDMYSDLPNDELENDILIDKLQLCVIISIKLLFVGLKLTIPLGKLLYQKFIDDQLFIVNNKNANKFLSFIIKTMRSLESHLNNNKVTSYKYGYEKGTGENQLQLNQLYDEMTSSNGYITLQLKNRSTDSSWRKAMAEYIFLKYVDGESTIDKKSDPRYSKFFSQPSAPLSSSSNYSFNSNSDSNSNSKTPVQSATSNNSLSMLKIAEQFLDEF
ncbi:uncharacterized protein AC631_05560 [Debaryomyces fabryi]|uniref:Uncharacterized protein n=1 Tax=Debaryomyces fabryi TaxID=58627 RepID=A0A0V1PR18_9ASCO|nr:uncharacterized protein AC631_05560 [Debaryomyces fabryi]KRZ98679.1 hypothetical protein AC631_05560 [Debaryomyces fabryi]CUM46163.1 unnamed protein product [Debaryomyces fabryi]